MNRLLMIPVVLFSFIALLTAPSPAQIVMSERSKEDALKDVDPSITFAKLFERPGDYRGMYVDIHCTVTSHVHGWTVACADDHYHEILVAVPWIYVHRGERLHVIGLVADAEAMTNTDQCRVNASVVRAKFAEIDPL